MVERRTELKRSYHRKQKLRKLKAKLTGATGEAREKVLYKIKRLSPFWTEASVKPATATSAESPKSEEPKKKAPPKPKKEKPAQ